MENFKLLKPWVEEGALSLIDLAFAQSVLKKVDTLGEEHAVFLAILFAVSRRGHLALDIAEISLKLLGMEEDPHLIELIQQGAQTFPLENFPNTWVCRHETLFYLQKNWVYETETLTQLERLSAHSPTLPVDYAALDSPLNQPQRMAVEKGMKHCLSLLTGGPGTGKTFTAAELVKTCLLSLSEEQKRHFKILLTAPTGKAVAHLEGYLRKSVGLTSSIRSGTLHSLLGIRQGNEEQLHPLDADLIIVDECSMIDAHIFSKLLASIPSGARVVLIGDKDQLPPVEAGSIFADLIDANFLPTTHLMTSLRSDRSEILELAKYIREGKAEETLEFLSQNKEIQWVDLDEEKKSIPQLYAHLWEECKSRFPFSFLEKPSPEQLLNQLGSFTILSCVRQGAWGVDALNVYFLNQFLTRVPLDSWWVAPVMITRNDHELQLYNGDLGCVIRKITPEFNLKSFCAEDFILFNDRKGGFRQIPALAINAFEYSYCLSVHKSQGSEYEETLILMPKGSELFGREVLYTAVTRARHKVSLAGSKELLLKSIATSSRKTSGIRKRAVSREQLNEI